MGKIVSSFWSYSQFDFRARSNVEGWIQNWTRHVFVKHGCHRRQPNPNLESSSFWPAPTPWHVMSVNYEQPFDELTFQVWLFYDHPNFKHVQVGRNYGQTDWKTDGRWCSRHTFQAGGIKRTLAPCVLQSAILPIQKQIQVNYTKLIIFVTPHIGYFWRMFWRKNSNWIFTSIFS